ncbi:MAG: radical SAM protein [Clostridia bacterium]|nr:radical SAM protein [Clostridia bacterium]
MKISKKDARMWFSFFAELDPDEALLPWQQEIVWATLYQIERAAEARFQALEAQIPNLNRMAGRTMFVGPVQKFPQGCKSCLFGTGLGAIRKTNRCNLQCPFCYDFGQMDAQPPVGEGMWEIGGSRFRLDDIDLLLTMGNRPTGVSYVYLEPFMEIEAYYAIIRRFHEAGIHQHMYTNGTLATEENLRALGEAGLDELRFNLGASGCADAVIRNMGVAKQYSAQVGIETPMTPELYERFLNKRAAILGTGIDFVNLAELHLNENNLGNYLGESLYCHRHGYISPIFSRELTLQLMRQAAQEEWNVAVHDCSNHTKFARDLNLRAKEGGWFGASAYGREFESVPYEAFLPALEDDALPFLEEEPLPEGYRPGDFWG